MKRILNRLTMFSDKQLSWLVFLLALVFRETYVIYYYFTKPIPEKFLYFDLALEIIEQGKIFYHASNDYFNVVGPVMPLWSALIMSIFGESYLVLYIFSAAGSALITLFTFKLARLILDKNTSLFIGLWSVFYFAYFYLSSNPGKDIWMSFFVLIIIHYLIKYLDKVISFKNILLVSLLYALLFHLDERFVVFYPFFLLYFIIQGKKNRIMQRVKHSILFSVLLLVFSMPWLIRNYQYYNKVVILSTRTEKYTDRIFGYPEKNEYFSDDFTDVKGLYFIHDYQMDSVVKGFITTTDAGYEISDVQIDAMRSGVLPKPLDGLPAIYSRIRAMYEPIQIRGRFERTGYFYYKKSITHNFVSFLSYGFVFIFSFFGFIVLIKTNYRVFIIFSTLILVYTSIHVFLIPYTVWRYRLPLDFIFIMLGILGVKRLWLLLSKKLKV